MGIPYLKIKMKRGKSPAGGKTGGRVGRGGKSDKPKFDPRHFERPGVSLDEIEEIKEAFDMFDKDGSGSIEPKELMDAMKKLGFDHDNEIVYQMIGDLDKDHSGEIEFDEFLGMMSAKMPSDPTREDIAKVFPLFDKDKTGTISLNNLKQIVRELGETMTEDDLAELIEHADSDGDGEVTIDDFYNIITKKNFP